MIILDTNVISEPLRRHPAQSVVQWIDDQALDTLYLTTITVAELRFGMASLPDGHRKQTLQSRLESEILPLFKGRILPFDIDASEAYGILMSLARSQGLAINTADGYIAAIAKSTVKKVASRDTSPFFAAQVEVIDPWVPKVK